MSGAAQGMTRFRLVAAKILLGAAALLVGCSAPAPVSAPSNDGGASNPDMSTAEAGATHEVNSEWCAALAVLETKCQRCHANPPQNGAPFALLTYEDTQALDRNGTPRFEKMREVVESDYMPPGFLKVTPPVEPLSAAEKSTLLAWLAGEPPLGAASCD